MVSKASEDLPEPDRPVNTASLSRGISTSTFLRLCSRAPRMVIARDADPALFWRFALSTSSISAVPGARGGAPRWARIAGPQNRDQAPMIESRNVGRTRRDFQCRVRIINGLFATSVFGSSRKQSRGGKPQTTTPPVRDFGTEAQFVLAAAAVAAASLRSDS